ncbi:MAG TPA: hypothetical protein VFC35_05390 [Gemmatimonadaceae bacterium]|nr:hypothetical protein [Gemmatimonadaceae bacterium]
MSQEKGSNRREFVERITSGAIALGVSGTGISAFASSAAAMPASESPAEMKWDASWLNGIKGNHAQIFDMPAGNGGFGLLHVHNYLQTYKDAYSLVSPHVVPIVSLYGMTTPLAFNDAMWAKYKFGAATNTNAYGTTTPITRNAYYAAAPGSQTMGMASVIDIPAVATISSLQSRGARFIVCNNAFNFWVGLLEAGGAGKAKDIRAEL